MIEKINKWLPILNTITIIVLAMTLVGGNTTNQLGGGTRFVNGLSTDSTSPSAGEVRTSTLTVTGATTLSSTLGVTSTTTIADGLKLTNPGICIEFYATSTATKLHMVASTTATVEGSDGIMLIEYGACAY